MEVNTIDALKTQFEYYKQNQQEFLKEYPGRYIVISEESVKGDFETELDAFEFAHEQLKAGNFIIQLVTVGNREYTQTFHSRVSFG